MSQSRSFRRFVIGVLLTAALIFVLSTTVALADVPWPSSGGQPDPYAYEDYCMSDTMPDDYSGGSVWKYSSEKDDAIDSNFYLWWQKFFNHDLYEKELEGVTGASVDLAWGITTGRPDVIIAVLDSGIEWHNEDAMKELRRKLYLNRGELPVSKGYAPGSINPPTAPGDDYDYNYDGVFNVTDYEDAASDAGGAMEDFVPPANSNGMLDPQELIWAFSDGVDDDGNGYVDDISGWDFFEDDNDPWDEMSYGHGTGESEDSGAEAQNGEGMPGTCPSATILNIRVGDSFIADVNEFAQGVVYGTDMGACVIQEALGVINTSSLGQAAIDYAYSEGAVVIASAADEQSPHHNYPSNYERTVQVNSVTKWDDEVAQNPTSYLYLNGCTNQGPHTHVAVPSTGCSSEATGRSSGMAALLYSAARNEVARGNLSDYPGLDKPLSPCEVKQLMTMNADDIDLSPDGYSTNFVIGIVDLFIGPSERYHSTLEWDPYFGYGRINAYKAVRAVDDGKIPPEAEIAEPLWFDHLDPEMGTVDLEGRVAAVRADSYNYIVEYGPGWNPQEGDWVEVFSTDPGDPLTEPLEGKLATIDLTGVLASLIDTWEERGGDENPNRFTFTLRVRVEDSEGISGEDRKTCYCYHDDQAYPETPRLDNPGCFSSPRFADLDDDGADELIVSNSDGWVHAYDSDFDDLPGWPVHATPLAIHTDSPGFSSPALPDSAYGSILGGTAVGDLDRDGSLEVVAGDVEGRVYAWDKTGDPIPGFPVETNRMYSIPERADWEIPGHLPGMPAEWWENRQVPDRVHNYLDRWNRLDKAIMQAPVLYNLDGSADGSLEIIVACLDQHVYAWHPDGSTVSGWPVKLVDPDKVAGGGLDELTHTCTFDHGPEGPFMGSKIVTRPSVADIDRDGDAEVICGTNEAYRETPDVSEDSFQLVGLLEVLEDMFDSGNSRVHAIHHDGTDHEGAEHPSGVPGNAYLENWPARLALLTGEILPNVGEGVNGPAAIADVDGDGQMEVGVSSVGGPTHLLEPDGSSFFGDGGDSLPKTLTCHIEEPSGPLDLDMTKYFMSALGGGCFARMGTDDHLSYSCPGMNIIRGLDLFLNSDQTMEKDVLALWDAESGDQELSPAWPKELYDLMFYVTPGAADLDGDGMQEVFAGSSYYDLRAFDGEGNEPEGWPKFTGGWMAFTPTVGDFDGDGMRELATTTREGWLFVWRTEGGIEDLADWPDVGHDPQNTCCYHTDARRPLKVSDLDAELLGSEEEPVAVKLTWTAPGDDGKVGKAASYDIRYSDNPITEESFRDADRVLGEPSPKAAGEAERLILDELPLDPPNGRTRLYFALQSRDDAENPSAVSNPASVSFGVEAEEPLEPGEPVEILPGEEPEQERGLRAPHPSTTWYLAEGTTGTGGDGYFETWVLLQNPSDETTTAEVTYQTEDGSVPGPTVVLEPSTRTTVNIADTLPNNWSVSTKVESDNPIICERSTYWNLPLAERWAAHASIGVNEPTDSWYLAEGSTGIDEEGHFETWVLVQNPGDAPATAQVTYLTPDGEVRGPRLELDAGTRTTVDVSETLENEWDVSTRVNSDEPVICERAVYWNSNTVGRMSAHSSIGVTDAADTWYLAEGSTGEDATGSFESWVLVMNPGPADSDVNITYLTPTGERPGPSFTLEPGTRTSVSIGDTVPGEWSVSAKVESDHGVIAERAVYWNSVATRRLCAHDSIGVNQPSTTWYLAEGSTGRDLSGLFETWVLVMNPGPGDAIVDITYMTPGGEVPGPSFTLLPGTRRSVAIEDDVPNEWSVSTRVEADSGVIAERALYWNVRVSGHDSIGASPE